MGQGASRENRGYNREKEIRIDRRSSKKREREKKEKISRDKRGAKVHDAKSVIDRDKKHDGQENTRSGVTDGAKERKRWEHTCRGTRRGVAE